jgi:hypothetical protein
MSITQSHCQKRHKKECCFQVTDECTIRTNSPKFPHDADFGCGQCSSKLEASQSKKYIAEKSLCATDEKKPTGSR